MSTSDFSTGIPAHYMQPGTSSFTDFISQAAPGLLPSKLTLPAGNHDGATAHATTIVSIKCQDGVIMAGDRRATMGNYISSRDIEKVFPADGYSLMGIAGAAGIGLEMVRLYQTELEHYEKIEGRSLTLQGKANRLATMLRGNLGLALQGLAAVPIYAGYDSELPPGDNGKLYSFDVVGGIYEEHDYDSVGSGSMFAKSALKKTFRRGLSVEDAISIAVEALYDAADDDSATGGPDLTRGLYPVVMSVTAEGTKRVSEEGVEAIARAVIATRTSDNA